VIHFLLELLSVDCNENMLMCCRHYRCCWMLRHTLLLLTWRVLHLDENTSSLTSGWLIRFENMGYGHFCRALLVISI